MTIYLVVGILFYCTTLRFEDFFYILFECNKILNTLHLEKETT